MSTKGIVLLIAAVLFDSSLTTTLPRQVNNCECQRNGNEYIQLAEHKCEKFTQYDNVTRLTHTHSCPAGQRFSAESCVCEHSQEVACEGCGPLVCEVESVKLYEPVMALRRAGDCVRANEIAIELFEKCVTKDRVALTLIILRFRAAERGEGLQCTSSLAEGCERLIDCYNLLLAPESPGNIIRADDSPNFLCENYNEAQRCLRCMDASGCQLAGEFKNDLRITAAQLCPHIQEFTCLADI